MYKLRFLLLSMMLMVSSCSTVDAIFGPEEPDVSATANKSQLTQENAQLGSEISDLRSQLKQLNQDIADRKVAQLKAEEEASLKAEQAIPKDRLWVTVSFRSGYWELTRQSRQALKRLAEKFLSKPRMQQIAVRGYTDDEPIGGYSGHRHAPRHPYKTNKALSQARAQMVVSALTSSGIPQDVVAAEGFGARDFVADNRTDAGRQRNRRAEIHLIAK